MRHHPHLAPQLSLLLALAALLPNSACSQHLSKALSPESSTMPSLSASKTSTALIRNVSVMARNEAFEPNGVATNQPRPIAFASVFLQLENPSEQTIEIQLQSVTVHDAKTGKLQMEITEPQTIALAPLENRTLDIHLSRETGYGKTQWVQADVTYRTSNSVLAGDASTQTVTSPAIAIQQW